MDKKRKMGRNPLADFDGTPKGDTELDYETLARLEEMEYAYEERIIEYATQDRSWKGEWD